MTKPRHPLIGKTVNRLTVIRESPTKIGYWLCECECGAQKDIQGRLLFSGDLPNCKCLLNTRKEKKARVQDGP